MKYSNIFLFVFLGIFASCKKDYEGHHALSVESNKFILFPKEKEKPIEKPDIYLDDTTIHQGGVSYFELLGDRLDLVDSVSVHGSRMPNVLISKERIIGLFACDVRSRIGECSIDVFVKTGQVFQYQFFIDTLNAGVRDMGKSNKDSVALAYNKACIDTAKMFSPKFFYFDSVFDIKILKMEETSPFGRKRIYHTLSSKGKDSTYTSRHLGVDLHSTKGSRFYAPNDCVVTFTGHLGGGWGNTMVVDYGNNTFQAFLHLDKFYFSKGDFVSKGDPLGETGVSGLDKESGAHLHSTFSFGNEIVSTFMAIEELNHLLTQTHRYNNLLFISKEKN